MPRPPKLHPLRAEIDTVIPLTIEQVAKRAGVNVETIRFYEREGR